MHDSAPCVISYSARYTVLPLLPPCSMFCMITLNLYNSSTIAARISNDHPVSCWFFSSIRATLGWMCERSRFCFLRASSLSPWYNASLLPWSLLSPCTPSGSWWPLALATASACTITSRRTPSSSSKERQTQETFKG